MKIRADQQLQFYTDIDANTHKVISIVDPTNPQDAATKNYVDTVITGINLTPYLKKDGTTPLTGNWDAGSYQIMMSGLINHGPTYLHGVTDFSYTGVKRMYGKVITVNAAGGAEYTTIQAAINSITDASAASPACVYIYPGDYTEIVTCKDYVHLVGADRATCRLLGFPVHRGPVLVINGVHSNVSNLTVKFNAVGWNFKLVKISNSAVSILTNVYINHSGSAGSFDDSIALWITDAATTVYIYNTTVFQSPMGVDAGGTRYAIYNTGNIAALENSAIIALTPPGAAGNSTAIYSTYYVQKPRMCYIEGAYYAIYETNLPGGMIIPLGCTIIGNVYGGDKSDQFLQKSLYPVESIWENDTYVTAKENSVFELIFKARKPTITALTTIAFPSQTANLQVWQDQYGGMLAYMTPAGLLGTKGLTVSGISKLGDGANNYLTTVAGGQLTLVGNTRVNREVRVEAVQAKKTGPSIPTEAFRAFGASGGVVTVVDQYSASQQNDVYFKIHSPSDLDPSEDVEFHVVWLPGASWTSGNYIWKLEYLVKDEYTGVYNTGVPTTISGVYTPVNATTMREDEFTQTIDLDTEEIMFCHFYRDIADSANDTGDVMYFEIEYTMNKLGELK